MCLATPDHPEASDPFARAMTDLHGEAGVRWVLALPTLAASITDRWGLRLEAPFQGVVYNYVVPGVRADGAEVVLKLGYPGRELHTEIDALRHFDGRGAVRLLEADSEAGALLLERLRSGESLHTVHDDREATSIAAQVMRQLWRPAPLGHSFPTVADWGRGFQRLRDRSGGLSGPLPRSLFDRAERLFLDLAASAAEPVLLHGDLHHGNILAATTASGEEAWLAIDPKGLVGEPAYEVGALLRNRVPETPNAGLVLRRRSDQLADELGLDRERIRGWAMSQAVLSACWSIEDHGEGWESAIRSAEILDDIERV